ncbi:MAG TPA: hypothetical protein VFX16_04585 [Pseudonocardiaceae bacterium]|nr:hypothetical protein [Pseudonocardiaceae bacterium]
MSRLLGAAAVTAGMLLLGAMGFQGTATAATGARVICDFTVTAAGNGMQVFSSDFSTVVTTMQTGEVFDISNTGNTTVNNILYRHVGFGVAPSWAPIQTSNTGVVFLVENPNSCSTV